MSVKDISVFNYRKYAHEVHAEGGDEEAGGQVKQLGALLDQASGVPDIDKSEHD